MNHLFQSSTADDIILRLQKIKADTKPLWGKMNAAQMMAHCQAPMEVYLGNLKLKQSLVGFLFGRIAKKKLFSEKPWSRGMPTAKEFMVTDDRDFEQEKIKLIELVKCVSGEGDKGELNVHPFFGKMTKLEWGVLGYKHLDHHLKQFGA
jgi:hypothetical protein